MFRCLTWNSFLWMLVVTGFLSCNQLSGVCFVPALPGYKNQPSHTLLLKKPLREISGISFHNKNQLVAINDEQGKLFVLTTATGKINTLSFGEKGDYEDIVRTPEGYYVLRSDGSLFLLDGRSGKLLADYPLSFSKYTEFESIAYDQEQNRLLLFCKNCGQTEPVVFGWSFNLNSHQLEEQPVIQIGWNVFRRLAKDDTIEFQPSAAAFHPVTGKLYMLSSTAKLLAVCNREGQPESVVGLNPDLFQQPEGLCFAPNGDLFISNEGRQSKATLLFFPFDPEHFEANIQIEVK
ncbi:MAG: SdiA-regulated domain-containing protein [Flavihumibacter sp.]|jgi:uncharacterized protein YjiK|nr:SdiA-regulated domain-containing protein [Flavihumibacter sp.]